MYLELHDNEKGNTLCARVKDIEYDYVAEQWVIDTHNDASATKVVKWILYDDIGIRCVWERPEGDESMPSITQRSARFTGKWEKGPAEVSI
ncbi:MAG: hypothetical protein WC242_03745 [Candidatus Paceibacterota bacterium]|jgi:hypothetical protein